MHNTMKLKLHHFKGGSMLMAQEIANEACILRHLLGASSIAYPRCLLHYYLDGCLEIWYFE
jgi:hypothetical protein